MKHASRDHVPSHGSISGRVVDASGAPISGAAVSVIASPKPHRDIAAITSADGEFRFGAMPAGSYRIAANAPAGQRSAEVEVEPGADARVEIRF